jgi:nicotinamidase-related amidase
MAGNLGFDVTLVDDATATFDRVARDGATLPAEEIHRVHLASLDGEFCRVLSTAAVLDGLGAQ